MKLLKRVNEMPGRDTQSFIDRLPEDLRKEILAIAKSHPGTSPTKLYKALSAELKQRGLELDVGVGHFSHTFKALCD